MSVIKETRMITSIITLTVCLGPLTDMSTSISQLVVWFDDDDLFKMVRHCPSSKQPRQTDCAANKASSVRSNSRSAHDAYLPPATRHVPLIFKPSFRAAPRKIISSQIVVLARCLRHSGCHT